MFGDALVYDNARVFGNARVYEAWRIKTGRFSALLTIQDQLRGQCGLASIGGLVRCYKHVRRRTCAGWPSIHDPSFLYKVGEVIAASAEESIDSCASGLHFSSPDYWTDQAPNDAVVLVCDVSVSDIITIQEGKIRARKCMVIGEID